MRNLARSLQQAATRLRMQGSSTAAILMYHRIAEPILDPWGLSVSPENFAAHLDVIRQRARPMSLQAFAAAQRQDQMPENAIVITFDDGYADNLYHAKPLLERYSIPATVFVTVGQLDSQREFWWDELERVFLHPRTLPETLSLSIQGQPKQWQLAAATHYSQDEYERDRHCKAWQGQPNSRMAFYYSVWQALRCLRDSQRQTLQDEILNWANVQPQARSDYRALTIAELQQLADGGMIEIGAHTMTHPALSAHSFAVQQDEIHRSKHKLEHLLGHPVKSFAYPFGDFDRNSLKAVEACGFEQACSTVQLGVWKGSNHFDLPRFEVQNWTKKDFEKKLDRWLN